MLRVVDSAERGRFTVVDVGLKALRTMALSFC